jgi:hypothetical protein
MPKSTSDALWETFSKLKQRMIWKFENYIKPGLPKNVKVAKYLPQFDIVSKFSREIKNVVENIYGRNLTQINQCHTKCKLPTYTVSMNTQRSYYCLKKKFEFILQTYRTRKRIDPMSLAEFVGEHFTWSKFWKRK